jgi:hypothetical protein
MLTKYRIAAALAATLVIAGGLAAVAVTVLFKADEEDFCW